MTGNRKILILTFPFHGLVNPSLSLANRLLNMGVHVIFSTSLSMIGGIFKETTPHGLTLAPFSDGHDHGKQPTTTLEQFMTDFATNGASGVTEILSSAAAKGQPFDHLVYTTGIPWAAKVATSNSVKSTLLWCQPATILDIYYYYFNGYESLISNPTSLINLPGLPPLTVDDLPSFFWPSRSKELDFILEINKDHIDALKTAPRILVNTFTELEIESIGAIDKVEFLTVGPLIQPEFLDGKGKDECIQWLNTKPKLSVVYVSFGSLATLSMEQVEEISIGLLKSGLPFLWVIRDSEKAGKLSKIEELKKHGMIVDWCSQVAVLNHPSIGCFVTHCGWNSTLESLAAGVPIVAFPMFSDQGTNAKMIEDVWKTGVRVKNRRDEDGVVEGNEIERCVEKVMTGKDGGEMRRNAEKWRDLARESLNDGGSSTLNLQAFLDDV